MEVSHSASHSSTTLPPPHGRIPATGGAFRIPANDCLHGPHGRDGGNTAASKMDSEALASCGHQPNACLNCRACHEPNMLRLVILILKYLADKLKSRLQYYCNLKSFTQFCFSFSTFYVHFLCFIFCPFYALVFFRICHCFLGPPRFAPFFFIFGANA